MSRSAAPANVSGNVAGKREESRRPWRVRDLATFRTNWAKVKGEFPPLRAGSCCFRRYRRADLSTFMDFCGGKNRFKSF